MSFQNQRRVPFTIPGPSGDSLDDLLAGELSGVPGVTGLLGLGPDCVELQWSRRRSRGSSTFQELLFGGGSRAAEPADGGPAVCRVDIPLEDLASATVKGRWGATITLTLNDLKYFVEIPGARGYSLRLKIARKHREHAEQLVRDLQMRLSELGLAHLDGEIARLEEGS